MSKNKKTIDIIVNIIVISVAVLVLLIAINLVATSKKGYSSFFGNMIVSVRTDSMEGQEKDSFKKHDIIFVKEVKEEDRNKLKKGEIITFWDNIDGNVALNTHRIERVIDEVEDIVSYRTKGDNALDSDIVPVDSSKVVGVYSGTRIPLIGGLILFLQGKVGFMIFIVLPSFALVIYALIKVVLSLKQNKKEELATAGEVAIKANTNLIKESLEKEFKAELEQKYKAELEEKIKAELEEKRKNDSSTDNNEIK